MTRRASDYRFWIPKSPTQANTQNQTLTNTHEVVNTQTNAHRRAQTHTCTRRENISRRARTYSFVGESRGGDELHAFQLSEVGWIAEHVDVKEFGHIATTPRVVLFAKRRPNVRAFLLHHRSLFRR